MKPYLTILMHLLMHVICTNVADHAHTSLHITFLSWPLVCALPITLPSEELFLIKVKLSCFIKPRY